MEMEAPDWLQNVIARKLRSPMRLAKTYSEILNPVARRTAKILE
jgi:hypothetical protein